MLGAHSSIRPWKECKEMVQDYPMSDAVSTYLGPMTHQLKGLCAESEGPILHKNKIGCSYVLKDQDEFIDSMRRNPLCRQGMEPNAEDNLNFIEAEAKCWTGEQPITETWKLYSDMWEGIPNVSDSAYAHNAANAYDALHQDSIIMWRDKTQRDYINRRLQLRFPDRSFCPISWQCIITEFEDIPKMLCVLHFRSLEVSTNILNDLYLFYRYFGGLLCTPDSPDIIEIDRMQITVADAHIISGS